MEEVIDNSHLHVPGDWLQLWKMKVPLKIEITIWRALRVCLQSGFNLKNKGVNRTDLCSECNQGIEDQEHFFLDE